MSENLKQLFIDLKSEYIYANHKLNAWIMKATNNSINGIKGFMAYLCYLCLEFYDIPHLFLDSSLVVGPQQHYGVYH